MSRYQTVVTATIANREIIDGIASFRHCQVKGRNGEIKSFWAFTCICSSEKVW